MNSVVLFSHGSLLCGAGETLKIHARRLQERGIAPRVEVGFLNYSRPDFLQTVSDLAHEGVTQIRVSPYFLIPGKFVTVDLPRRIEEAKAAFPQIEFSVAEAIGFDERLGSALLHSAKHAHPHALWRSTLYEATAHCRPDPLCPLYNTPLCPKHGGEGVLPELVSHEADDLAMPWEKAALLVMVHGSPRAVANEEMYRVVETVKRKDKYPIVEVGFMEVNRPSIAEAIDACIAQGATEVIAVPYFLHTGTHVADDLPHLLEEGRTRHPETIFRLGDYLGKSEIVTDILADRILNSAEPL